MAASETTALIVHVKPFGESEAIVRFLTRDTGMGRGLVRITKANRGVVQVGNLVRIEHFRRLEHQLGKLTIEEIWSAAPLAMGDRKGPLLLNWLTELTTTLLPEEHGYPDIFEAAMSLLRAGVGVGLWRRVAAFEKLVLSDVGYGLALGEDPVREGAEDALWYVSPNSGRAVGMAAGAPYADRMLMLPHVWGGPVCGEAEDARRAFTLTRHFLDLAAHGKAEWGARRALLERLA
jgi:DNA repair protein RecO (recombination protein O)